VKGFDPFFWFVFSTSISRVDFCPIGSFCLYPCSAKLVFLGVNPFFRSSTMAVPRACAWSFAFGICFSVPHCAPGPFGLTSFGGARWIFWFPFFPPPLASPRLLTDVLVMELGDYFAFFLQVFFAFKPFVATPPLQKRAPQAPAGFDRGHSFLSLRIFPPRPHAPSR